MHTTIPCPRPRGPGGGRAGPGRRRRARAPSAVAGSAACRASCALCAELGLLIRIETCSSMYTERCVTVHLHAVCISPARRRAARCSGRHKRRGHPRPIPTSPRGGEHAQPCYGRGLRSECSNPAAAMCTSIAWFHGDCGDDRGDATPSRDALDGASVGSPGAPRVSRRQACAARGESGVSCGVWPLRLGLGGRSMRR